MNTNSQINSDTTFNAEPVAPETPAEITETPVQAPELKKTARGAKAIKAVKPVKPAKPARTPKADKLEEIIAPVVEEGAAKTVAKTAKTRKSAKPAKTEKSAKTVKPVKAEKPVRPAKVAAVAKTRKAAKPEKPAVAAKAIKSTKAIRSAKKIAKNMAAPAAPAKTAANGRGKGARYTTNELNNAAKKAGLTVEFTPVVTKPANIGRGPAKEFKVDAVVAHLRGSNGDLIRDRGPGTPFYNDAESLAAVAIFETFRSRTFHNKLKVEIL
jgi:hypothetical protein